MFVECSVQSRLTFKTVYFIISNVNIFINHQGRNTVYNLRSLPHKPSPEGNIWLFHRQLILLNHPGIVE